MTETMALAKKLSSDGDLSFSEMTALVSSKDDDVFAFLKHKAQIKSREIFFDKIYIRGLIEFTNYCKNDCLYCGIRKSNLRAERYRLTKADILKSCAVGYPLGFRTFVLQGGEDLYFTDERMEDIISSIKAQHSDCAVTLSIGERSTESYQRLYNAGADRFLLRHETITDSHYKKLHPCNLSLENRINCLRSLKEIGFQTGCGFMVGSPFQTYADIARDLKFIKEFKPHMVGIGPFIPHRDTPFGDKPQGDVRLTLLILSIVRLLLPSVLLPATTALGTASKSGQIEGILHGANVIMPNLSPKDVRHKYMLYNNKLSSKSEAAENLESLKQELKKIGYEISVSRGDAKN